MTASFEVIGWTLGPATSAAPAGSDRANRAGRLHRPQQAGASGGATGSGHTVSLRYLLDDPALGRHELVERLDLPVTLDLDAAPRAAIALDLLAVAAGVSYFKAAAPAAVGFAGDLRLDAAGTTAMAALYDDGLREFSLHNDLPVPRPIDLPAPAPASPRWPRSPEPPGSPGAGDDPGASPAAGPGAGNGDAGAGGAPGRQLVPIGAGRDSSLLAALLARRSGPPPLLLSIGENPYAQRVAAALGLELLTVRRTIDPQLLALNAGGARNGHVPVTAINSLIAVVVACATGCSGVLMANERSASQPTRWVGDTPVNHQYSKSFEFELLLRAALAPVGVDYCSALRPWGELPIAAAFAACNPALHRAFMSCNRAFVRDPARRSDGWCGQCPKCRSVFLSLAPFMPPGALAAVFGRDLLADPAQLPGFLALVEPDAKPFECVGEIDEARLAVALLAADDAWRRHPVVRELAGLTPPPAGAGAFERSSDHAVPAGLLADLASAIDPPADLLARAAAPSVPRSGDASGRSPTGPAA